MNRATIVPLKALIVVMIGIILASQVFVVPGVAESTAHIYPEFAYLKLPGIVVAVAFLFCVELALVCVWRLLSLVRTGTIFSRDAFKWVDAILLLVIVATVIILGAFIALQIAGVGSGPVMVICILGVIVGSGFALLVVVLRRLLRQASQLEHDLSEVV